MTEALTVLALFLLGSLFIGAAYLSYRRAWKASAYVSLTVAAFFFVMGLPTTREFMRSTVWAAFVTSLEATGQGLVRLNKTIEGIRSGMQEEATRREAQQEELDTVQRETRQMQESLRSAQKLLEEQQKRLSDVDQLLKSFYEAGTTLSYITESDGGRLGVIPHDSNHVTVYVLLPEPAIHQTLQLQWHVYAQPRNSYLLDGNLVMFRWGQSEGQFRSQQLSVTYVPDPTGGPSYEALERRGDRIFADGHPLFFAFLNLDPAFQELVKEEGRTEVTTEDLAALLRRRADGGSASEE